MLQFALAFTPIPGVHLHKSPALRPAPFAKGGFRGFFRQRKPHGRQ